MKSNLCIIVPVFNRPAEIEELLQSLSLQSKKQFEVIIVEDGSQYTCESIIQTYSNRLNLKYFYKQNTGPGETRNFGVSKSDTKYVIFLDSDCTVPVDYIKTVSDYLDKIELDVFGGPDTDHPSFSIIQKAVNYAMTSFLTTGGIRGNIKSLEKFMPRSFNMGVSKIAFENAGGFPTTRFAISKAAGEDIALSITLKNLGYKIGFIKEAFVYHKRRINMKLFLKQAFNFGLARWNLSKLYPKTLKLVHLLPTAFTLTSALLILLAIFINSVFITPLLIYGTLIFLDASVSRKSVQIGYYAVIASFLQLFGYGFGFLYGLKWKPAS